MAGNKGIRAGRAYVEMYADQSKLVRAMRLGEKSLHSFGGAIQRVGKYMVGFSVAVGTALFGAAKHFASYGDQVAKMAKRTGLSVQTLSELSYVATQTGSNFETVELAFRKMQRSIYDAGRGLSTQKDALEDLGLTFADLDGLSPEEQFKILGEAISGIEDPTRQAGIAMTFFGRTGTNLLPMFAKGAAGIEQLQQQARDLGLTMSNEEAQGAEDLTDAFDRLIRTVKMVTFRLGAALAPVLEDISDRMAAVLGPVSLWIRRNQQLIVGIAKMVATAAVVGSGLIVLGFAMRKLALMSTFLAGAVKVAGATIAGIKIILAGLLSPVGLMIAGIVTLGVVIVKYTSIGRRALAWLSEKFGDLSDDVKKTLGAIGAAIASGDLSLATKILWLLIKMEWHRGLNAVKRAWYTAQTWLTKGWFALVKGAQTAIYAIEVTWYSMVAGTKKAWNGFTSFFARTWEHIKAVAAKSWNWIKALFDDSLDLDAANALVEQKKQEAISKVNAKRDANNAEIEAKHQAKLRAADESYMNTIAGINEQAERDLAALDAEHADKIAANEAKLVEAQQQWRAAIEAARNGETAVDGERGPEDSDIATKIADLSSGFAQAVEKVSTIGTFNTAAAGRLGGDRTAERTAKATEQTARNTEDIADRMGAGLSFA